MLNHCLLYIFFYLFIFIFSYFYSLRNCYVEGLFAIFAFVIELYTMLNPSLIFAFFAFLLFLISPLLFEKYIVTLDKTLFAILDHVLPQKVIALKRTMESIFLLGQKNVKFEILRLLLKLYCLYQGYIGDIQAIFVFLESDFCIFGK